MPLQGLLPLLRRQVRVGQQQLHVGGGRHQRIVDPVVQRHRHLADRGEPLGADQVALGRDERLPQLPVPPDALEDLRAASRAATGPWPGSRRRRAGARPAASDSLPCAVMRTTAGGLGRARIASRTSRPLASGSWWSSRTMSMPSQRLERFAARWSRARRRRSPATARGAGPDARSSGRRRRPGRAAPGTRQPCAGADPFAEPHPREFFPARSSRATRPRVRAAASTA